MDKVEERSRRFWYLEKDDGEVKVKERNGEDEMKGESLSEEEGSDVGSENRERTEGEVVSAIIGPLMSPLNALPLPREDPCFPKVEVVEPRGSNAFQVGRVLIETPCRIVDRRTSDTGILLKDSIFVSTKTGVVSVFTMFNEPYHLPLENLSIIK